MTDKTEYARSLGYNGPAPILVEDGKVLSYENKDWFLFCEECREGKHAGSSMADLVLHPLPQYGCVVGVAKGTLLSAPMGKNGIWWPEEVCEVSDPWEGGFNPEVSRDDGAIVFLIAVNALLGSSFKLSDFDKPWGDAEIHKAAPEKA